MNIFYITGPDGSGKTTYLKKIEQHFQSKGEKITNIWVRSPKILTKPLMAFCRLIGLTKYKKIDDIRYGTHEFYRSKFVSWLFPILQLVDFKLMWFLTKKKISNDSIVLIDRFSLDTLVDLMVDTKNYKMHNSPIGRILLDTIPENTKIIVLSTDEALIKKRKLDTRYDPQLTDKIKCYYLISRELGIQQVCNNTDIDTTKRLIFNKLKI